MYYPCSQDSTAVLIAILAEADPAREKSYLIKNSSIKSQTRLKMLLRLYYLSLSSYLLV